MIRSYEGAPSGFKQIGGSKTCKLFPNPTNGQLTVASINPETKLLGIFSSTGNEVIRLNKYDTTIDVSKLSKGLYYLRTKTELAVENIAFIKI